LSERKEQGQGEKVEEKRYRKRETERRRRGEGKGRDDKTEKDAGEKSRRIKGIEGGFTLLP